MRIHIPVEVPAARHDEWCQAFRAGHLEVKHPGLAWAEGHGFDTSYPEAFEAGMSHAIREIMKAAGR